MSLALAAGLAVVGHCAFLLALLGLLRPWVVLPLLAGANLAGRKSWQELARGFRAGSDAEPGPGRFWWLLPAGALLPLLLLPLYPSTAFDATMYHLPFARAFAETGRAPFLRDLRFPVFPQLMEFLFAVLFPAGRDLAAQCLSVIATLLTGWLLVAWGRDEGEPAAGWIAAAAFLGNPIVAYFGATPYVEPGLILFSTAAFYSFARWQKARAGGWLALAGFFAGSAAAVKYLGLFFVAALAVAAVATSSNGRRWRSGLFFL
ncbi:MAG TPA: glycosyltransferase family 39 protein, partial [Thermoanaerobaculia bacterium]|nr:glycosyltransferase family 39 protein [Thermoanaerobaculia bacterium]